MIFTKRLTCGWNPCTEMMRLSSRKLLGFYGTNLQNPSQSLMKCVVAPDGFKFGQPDQSGAEALIVAMETRPGKFRSLFDLGMKPHSYMALQIFTDMFRGDYPASRYKGVDPKLLATYPEAKDLFYTIKNSEDEYYIGKKTIHSFNYDEGPQTYRITTLEESEGRIVLSYQQGKEFKEIWRETFPEIVEQQAVTVDRVTRDGVLRNLFGFPRRFDRLFTDAVKRQTYAFIPQSTVATITNIAFTEITYKIIRERLPWTLLNNKHDSFLVQIPDTKEHEEMFIEASNRHMGRELISGRNETYRMKVGISFGYNWGKYHKETNKDGMREMN